MYIRKLLDDEYSEVIKLIYDSVHTVCKDDYSKKELDAWAPPSFDFIKFQKALNGCVNLVALKRNLIVGFISMEKSGYINRLYTHKDFLRQGIASSLMKKAEEWAVNHNVYELSLDSSRTAKGFYIKMGFSENGVSVTSHRGVIFRNAVMKKILER